MVAGALLPALTVSADFLGVTWTGDTYRVSAASGTGALIGPTGWSQLNSMARNSSGQFIAASTLSPPRLLEVDPGTGQAGVFHIPFLNDIRALAFSPVGDLYAVEDLSSAHSDLYFLDLAVAPGDSGIKVFIGRSTIIGIQGMTFAPDGTLYGWSVGRGLITIDPQTAEATDVNLFPDGSSAIQTLAFGPDGTLYGIHDSLYTIDTETGAIALVGAGGYSSIRGFEWEPGPCPADLDEDGVVAVPDLLALLAAWSTDPGGPPDFDGDGNVGVPDLMTLLAAWGPCT